MYWYVHLTVTVSYKWCYFGSMFAWSLNSIKINLVKICWKWLRLQTFDACYFLKQDVLFHIFNLALQWNLTKLNSLWTAGTDHMRLYTSIGMVVHKSWYGISPQTQAVSIILHQLQMWVFNLWVFAGWFCVTTKCRIWHLIQSTGTKSVNFRLDLYLFSQAYDIL